MRDQVSFQEDRIKQTQEELVKLKGHHVQKLVQENQSDLQDIERLSSHKKETQTSLAQEIKKCEVSLDNSRDKREKARKELERIREHLKILVDVKSVAADLEEAEHLCRSMEEKDRELLEMMKSRDSIKKEWLKNWVNIEVHELMRKDRDDVRNHIEMYSDDLSKLSKIIEKFQEVQGKQQDRFNAASDDLKLLENEMQILSDERKECERELKQNEVEQNKLKQELEQKKKLIGNRDKDGGSIEQQIEQKDREIDRLTDILDSRDEILQRLEERIQATGVNIAASLYSAFKGDLVDELLAKYINLTQCPVPIKRLGNGYYLFGTKKIFAKIMNGKLVIRVGGGFMVIEEFIASYADQEMKKVAQMEAN